MKKWFERATNGKLKPLQKKWQAGKAKSKAFEKSC
jgi:hypothetical protein